MSSWKRDVASGLVVLLPILLSAYVVYWLYAQIAGIPVLQDFEAYEKVALLLALAAVTVLGVGYMMRTKLGDVVEGWIDDLANRVPVVRIVYNASKMAVETAVTGTEDLQTPVKLEPWNGMRMTAFKTGKTAPDGRDVLFLPTAPNITTGFVLEVAEEDYEETDERVEDALTRILSAGFGESRDTEMPLGSLTNGREGAAGGGEPTGDAESTGAKSESEEAEDAENADADSGGEEAGDAGTGDD